MNTNLEKRLNTLEARYNPEPLQRVAIIIIRPGEDKLMAITRYYAERDEVPLDPKAPHLHVLISREDSDT